jgi:hypothetical protein
MYAAPPAGSISYTADVKSSIHALVHAGLNAVLSCYSRQSSAVRLFAVVYVHYVQSAQCLPKRLPGLGVAPSTSTSTVCTDARIRQPDLRSNSRCLPTSQLGLVPTGRTTSSVRFRHTSPTVVNMPLGAIARANFPRDRLGRVLWATSVVRLRYVICGLGPREDLACGIPTGVAARAGNISFLGLGLELWGSCGARRLPRMRLKGSSQRSFHCGCGVQA